MGAGCLPSYEGYPSRVYGITDFVGEFFLCGAAGGSALHFTRAFLRDTPGASDAARLARAVSAVRQNAPRVAGTFAFYCAGFSAIESAVSLARRKEDFWSSFAASAATWGLHGMRRGGAPAAARCALLGTAGLVALRGFNYAAMAWLSRQGLMTTTGRDQPLPVAIHAKPDDRS